MDAIFKIFGIDSTRKIIPSLTKAKPTDDESETDSGDIS